MKIKKGYRLRESGGSYVVVAMDRGAAGFGGMLTLNGTGAFLWKELQKECTEQELIEAMLNKYEVSQDVAKDGVQKFLTSLRTHGFLEG